MADARPIDGRPFGKRARSWTHDNLFSSRFNSGLTVVTVAILGAGLFAATRFIVSSADWEVIEVNRRLITLGRLPAEDGWRMWPPLYFAAATAGWAFGMWGKLSRRDLVWLVAAMAFMFLVLVEGANALRFAGVPALFAGAYVATAYGLRDSRYDFIGRQVGIAAAVVVIPLAVITIGQFGGPPTRLWGGIMLNIMIASIAIVFSIPLGILLALGRAGSLKTVKYACIGFIEFVRAGPLIVWLFIGRFVAPDFLPESLSDIDLVLRAMLVFTLFTAAYIAEIVRGGLQSVPPGQVEAAKAVGLGSVATTVYIVLPQALRAVIPALVSQLISLWKDTTLVTVIGVFDGLRAAEATLTQPGFTDNASEVFLFMALAFWVGSFSMSRLSMRLERNIGIGER
jgi:general L-amino acid transport system permease protein